MSKINVASQLFGGSAGASLDPNLQNLLTAPDIAAAINQGLCPDVDALEVSDPYLAPLFVDDSGSIGEAGLAPTIMEGVNSYRKELLTSNAADDILINITLLSGKVIYPFGYLAQSPELTPANYEAIHGTPLNDRIISVGGTLLGEWKRQRELGYANARGMLIFATDGYDEHSRHSEEEAASMIAQLRSHEGLLVMMMGIENKMWQARFNRTFKEVGLALGVAENMILTCDASRKEILAAFRVASRASKMGSQGAKSFSQLAAGGLAAVTQ